MYSEVQMYLRSMTQRSSQVAQNTSAVGEICAFCLDQMQDPVQLQDCKHSFCRSCLKLYCEARTWQAERCPLCRCWLRPYVRRMQRGTDFKNSWRLTALLLLALVLLSFGAFFVLLIYW